jgi:uncharacterized protein with HEPN domain
MSEKSKRNIELFVLDVLVGINKIKEYTSPFASAEDFRYSPLHWDATIRQFEIIGEALKNLLQNDSFCISAPRYFRKIVDFRNVITHGYFGIDSQEVWDMVRCKIGELEEDVLNVVKNMGVDMKSALEYETIEYLNIKDISTADFLENLMKTFCSTSKDGAR